MKNNPQVSHKSFLLHGILLSFLMLCYAITSYLIFLRDDFILERISVLSAHPEWLIYGRKLAKVLHVNSVPTFMFIAVIVGLFVIYISILRMSIKYKPSKEISKSIRITFMAMLIFSFLSFPALSTDVFDYIAANRVIFVHQKNPWLTPPQEITQDEFMYLGSWKFRASVYGPVQFIVSSFIHLIGGNNIIRNIIAYKIVNLLFVLLTIYVIAEYLSKHAPKYREFGVMLFALNPLLHIEIIGNVHNDIVMGFLALMSVILFLQKKLLISAIALSLSLLAKMASFLFVIPLSYWLLIKGQKKELTTFILVLLLVSLFGFLSLGNGLLGFIKNIGVQSELYLHSLPTIIRYLFVQLTFSLKQANIFEKLITIPVFSILAFRVIKKFTYVNLIGAVVLVMMIYLIILAPMLQPWYLVWFLPLTALLKPGKILWTAVVFYVSSLLHYAILFISYYFSPLAFVWQILMYLVMVLPPILYWYAPQTWYTRIRPRGVK